MAVYFSRFLLLAATFAVTFAQDTFTIVLPWCKPSGGSYERRQAREGDTVEFDWWESTFHNAEIYPSGDCFDSGGQEFLSESSGASYTFTASDVGLSKTFVCSISDHCAQGQLVVFDVLSSDAEMEYLLSSPCGDETGVLKKDGGGDGNGGGNGDGSGGGKGDVTGNGGGVQQESAGARVVAGAVVAVVTTLATATTVLSVLW